MAEQHTPEHEKPASSAVSKSLGDDVNERLRALAAYNATVSQAQKSQAAPLSFPKPLPLPDNPTHLKGTWHAVNVSGETVYQSGSVTVHGAVTLDGGAKLFIESGAVASGINTEKPGLARITVSGGGELVSSYIQNAYTSVFDGGVTQGNQFNKTDVYINSGATSIDDSTFLDGYTIVNPVYVYSGGVVINPTVDDGGVIRVSGGTVSNALVDGGGSVWVYTGDAQGAIVESGGSFYVKSSGSASDIIISSGGKADINGSMEGGGVVPDLPQPKPGAVVLKGTWYARVVNGTTYYTNGDVGYTMPVTLGGLSKLFIESGAVVSGLCNDGTLSTVNVMAGGTFMNSIVNNGYVNVYGGGTSMNNYMNSDPYTIYSGGVSINDIIYNSGYNKDKTYVSSGATMINPDVWSGGTISVYSGGTIVNPGVDPGGSVLINGGEIDACFLKGTKILTPSGDVAVENLKVGDAVIAYGPQRTQHRIKWIGQKTVTVPPSEERKKNAPTYPIRIVRDALGPNCPHQDLLVTEEHCVALDDKLHPIRMLVNNASIFYDTRYKTYTYFHIETEAHCVLCANGAPFESYLNTNDYHGFELARSSGEVNEKTDKTWRDDASLPLSVTQETVSIVHERLRVRAVEKGFKAPLKAQKTTYDNDLHLLLPTGETVRPSRIIDGTYHFQLTSTHEVVHLASRASRPAEAIGPYVDDRRRLGVLIDRITIVDGHERRDLKSFLLAQLSGWHDVESQQLRWTDGRGKLPLTEYDHLSANFELEVHVVQGGPYIVEGTSDAAFAATQAIA